MSRYYVTGNEYVSLPTVREADAGIDSITFLHMGAKGMIEIRGAEEKPLLIPVVAIGGVPVPLKNIRWHREQHWILRFSATAGGADISGCLLAPLGERGFVYTLEAKVDKDCRVSLALEGCWAQTLHVVNESKPVEAAKNAYASGWNHGFVMDMRPGLPLFAWAPIGDDDTRMDYASGSETVRFQLKKEVDAKAGAVARAEFYWGLGYEEVAAATSAKEMLRQGFETLHRRTASWLLARCRPVADEKLSGILNLNMFFSFFFASGVTLDTEEFCLMTSRSPRYYVSAAYWDRDSLLWSFPAILLADAAYAKKILQYVFTRQIRNVGIHSRFIDGTVLEPGFELDELCAPVIALHRYVQATGDRAFVQKEYVREGLCHILDLLESKKHPGIDLYETFLQPTDDMHVYPYLTYDNVLVWKAFQILGEYLEKPGLLEKAEAVKKAIWRHCTLADGGGAFAWSVDLQGGYDVYDEPPGSLMLLSWYGFVPPDDPVYRRTVEIIRDPGYAYSFAGKPIAEIGCPHAPHPWVLSICNSLLCGHKESALVHLAKTEMDNGIACESVDEVTGKCATGEAFATCAGFLAFALHEALKENEA